jgi:hypothetical protein
MVELFFGHRRKKGTYEDFFQLGTRKSEHGTVPAITTTHHKPIWNVKEHAQPPTDADENITHPLKGKIFPREMGPAPFIRAASIWLPRTAPMRSFFAGFCGLVWY